MQKFDEFLIGVGFFGGRFGVVVGVGVFFVEMGFDFGKEIGFRCVGFDGYGWDGFGSAVETC